MLRPAGIQPGQFREAARLGRHNLDLLGKNGADTPILFLEPSCYSMFAEDYRELGLPNAEQIAKRCFLFEKFVDELLEREPHALAFNEQRADIAIHAHCHAKSILKPGFMARLAARLPGRKATLLDTGCCGMAGAFGALESKYELSLKVGADLVQKIQAQPSGLNRGRFGHELPASNRTHDADSSEAHGRVAGGRDCLRTNEVCLRAS